MAVDFSKILGKQAEAIEKPKPLPIGTYLCTNPKLPEFLGIGKAETPAAVFKYLIIAPQEDVDPDELKDFGDWKGKTIKHNMFLSEASEFRTKETICEVYGIDEAGKTLGQIFNETINKQLLVTVKHRPSDDGTEMFTDVEKLAAA